MSEEIGRPIDGGRPVDTGCLAEPSGPSFTGVVLAGGHSCRFGEENKAVAVVEGTTFVERVVEAVHTVAGDAPVIGVKNDDQRTTIERGLVSGIAPTFAFDAASFEGPVSGLYGSLPEVDREWLFLTGCDMPRLSAPAIAWLANHLQTTRPTPDALVPVHSDGDCEPLHAFYRRDAVAGVRSRLEADASLRALVEALPEPMTVPIPAAPPDVPLATSVENVNTRREYHRVRRAIER